MKKILAVSWDHRHLNVNKWRKALLQYRNTPSHRNGLTPAKKLDRHPVQDSCQHTISLSHQSGSVHLRKQISKQTTRRTSQRSSILLTHTRLQTLKSDPALHYKTSSQNIATYMVKLLPLGHTEDTTLEHRVVGFLCETGISYGVDHQLPVSPQY